MLKKYSLSYIILFLKPCLTCFKRLNFYTTKTNLLPRLPLPSLNQTLHKYLLSVKPLLNKDEYTKTIKIVQDFGKKHGVGEELQCILKEKAEKETNWLSNWWLNIGYLSGRYPLLINSNPGLLFPNLKKDESLTGQISKILSSILKFKHQLDSGLMPRENIKGIPLSMSQYPKMFGSCRVPGKSKDTIVTASLSPFSPMDESNYIGEKSDHSNSIIVLLKNHIWLFDTIGLDDKPLNVKQIENILNEIMERSNKLNPISSPVNVLTTENRTTWAHLYEKLKMDKRNEKIFRAIQECCLVLCLDEINGALNKDGVANNILHGGKCNHNTCNRWFDKTLQIIVDSQGHVGINFEHSLAEGPPYVTLMDFIIKNYNEDAQLDIPPSSVVTEPIFLEFSINDGEIVKAIEAAQNRVDSFIDDLDLRLFTFERFGKEELKAFKASPDAFIQVALQLAYYRMNNKPCATYESASTRKYDMGRTETIRSCAWESLEFSKAMINGAATENFKSKSNLLKKALSTHQNLTKEASNGYGVDRHLMGLKLVAIEQGMNVPELFMEMAYTRSTHFQLSTSQVPSNYDATMFYGPAVPDGYGFCYNPMEHHLNYAISSIKSSSTTDTKLLSAHFQEALMDMVKLLEG